MADDVDIAPKWHAINRITSLPVLGLALIAFTLLAVGPLQGIDRALHRPWS